MEYIEAITKLLGGRKTLRKIPKSDFDFIQIIRAGLPVEAVTRTASALSLSEERAFQLIRMSKRTALRRKEKKQPLRREESERLLRLVRILAAATDVLGTRGKAYDWLNQSNKALGGETPFDLIDTDVGFQNVIDVLHRIEYGVYS